MTKDYPTWAEYRIHLKETLDTISKDIDVLEQAKQETGQKFVAIDKDLKSLEKIIKKVDELSNDVIKLKVTAGFWGAIGGLIIAGLITFLANYFPKKIEGSVKIKTDIVMDEK